MCFIRPSIGTHKGARQVPRLALSPPEPVTPDSLQAGAPHFSCQAFFFIIIIYDPHSDCYIFTTRVLFFVCGGPVTRIPYSRCACSQKEFDRALSEALEDHFESESAVVDSPPKRVTSFPTHSGGVARSVTPPPPPLRLIDFGWSRAIKELGTWKAEASLAPASEHTAPSEEEHTPPSEEEEERGTPPSEEEEEEALLLLLQEQQQQQKQLLQEQQQQQQLLLQQKLVGAEASGRGAAGAQATSGLSHHSRITEFEQEIEGGQTRIEVLEQELQALISGRSGVREPAAVAELHQELEALLSGSTVEAPEAAAAGTQVTGFTGTKTLQILSSSSGSSGGAPLPVTHRRAGAGNSGAAAELVSNSTSRRDKRVGGRTRLVLPPPERDTPRHFNNASRRQTIHAGRVLPLLRLY